MEYIKQALKSKTVWSGILKIVAGIGLLCTGEQTMLNTAIEILPIVWGAIDVFIRHKTTMPLSAK
jgi:uncharacterized membrane protein